jgi:predicted dienelactone hydrolase
MNRVGVAGHSFGAYSALASSGRILVGPLGGKINLTDPRIKACISMSSPGSLKEKKNNSYASYSVPCLHMTGTEDVSPVADTKASDRRIPFDSIDKGDQYLVTFNGGDHMIFSGRFRKAGKKENDDIFQELIKQSTLEFWDAYLKGKPESKKWLTDGDFEKTMGDKAVVEKKIKI